MGLHEGLSHGIGGGIFGQGPLDGGWNMNEVAVWTEDVVYAFQDKLALAGLSLVVPRGTVFGLLGPNGAGKTTTLRLLLGLLKPASGQAAVLGYDTRSHGEDIRRSVGVLMEHVGLYERLSAAENLEFYGRIRCLARGAREQRAKELLSEFGLWHRRAQRVGTWSRGMKQKLAVARALLHQPELVFLDEPTAGLDPEAAATLRQHIARLAAEEGKTVFLTTHNLSEAQGICDELGIIRSGRLVVSGSVDAVIQQSTFRTARLSVRGLTERILQDVRSLPSVVDANVSGESEMVMRLKEDENHTVVINIVRAITEAGAEVVNVHSRIPSLEDAYHAIAEQERSSS
jgi:ABC-2 type transport system ATP-binding protein